MVDPVVLLIVVFALIWIRCPRTPLWKTKWWERHINRNLDPEDPRMD